MARHPKHQARGQQLVAVAAVGLLAVVTALAFGRVFTGQTPTLKLLATALLSLAVAALLERRSLLLATIVSAAMLLAAVGWLVFPQTLWYGLPTKETLVTIGHALEKVGEQARVQVAPTPPLAPLVLAAVTAMWTATFSAHALAIRAGSPLLALLPPAALVGFADTVLEDGARPFYAVTFLLAALAVVFMDGLRRIRQWGPMWAWQGRNRRLAVFTARGAQRVAVLAVAVAALVPGILPGFRSQALVDFSTSSSDAVDLDPFVSIKAQLDLKEPIDLFRVTSVDPATGQAVPMYWRLYALDRFNGTDWTNSDPEGTKGQLLSTPASFAIPALVDATPMVEQHYHMLVNLDDPWLPMAYPPGTVQHPDITVRYNADITAVMAPDGWQAGDEYLVSSHFVAPTPDQLNHVTQEQMRSAPWYLKDTFLPDDVPQAVHDLALALTRDATTPYEKVYAIQQYFTSGNGFVYATDADTRSDTNALVDFLTVSKRGFCQQFATAMTVLVRELGIPARVAVGFRTGTRDGDTFTVSSRDAHSWVEVYFPVGWLSFEPTPSRPSPLEYVPGSYLNPDTGASCPQGAKRCDTGGKKGRENPSGVAVGRHIALRERARWGGGPIPEVRPIDTGYHVPYRLLLLALLVLAGAFLVLTPIAKALWRRRMLHRTREPRDLVLATYRVFDGGAADLGLGRARGETLAEYRDRLARTVRFSDGHLHRLTAATTRAAYSDRPVSEDEARETGRAARTALHDMRKEAGLVRRIAGFYRLGV